LIVLEAVGRLNLLEQIYQTLRIPPEVAREWGSPCPAWITVQAVQNQALVQALQIQVDLGEAEAIALAVEVGVARLIIDELRGRRIAARLGLTITGTVGVVVRAKQLSYIPLVRPVLDDMRAAGFRLSDALVQQTLQIAGE
jgi:predicted nucleic acid-binding protein